jgi:hypothetical protein
MKTITIILLQFFALTVSMAQSIEFTINGEKQSFSKEQITIEKTDSLTIVRAGEELTITLLNDGVAVSTYHEMGAMPWFESENDEKVSVYFDQRYEHLWDSTQIDELLDEGDKQTLKSKYGDLAGSFTISSYKDGVITGTFKGAVASLEASYWTPDMVAYVSGSFEGIKLK